MKILMVLTGLFLSTAELDAKLHPSSVITYSLSGGRLGDNLLAFSHALWLSYVVDLPLAYLPFPYSNALQLSNDPLLTPFDKISKLKNCEIKSDLSYFDFYRSYLSKSVEDPKIFTLRYFPESTVEYLTYEHIPFYHQVNWDDPKFIERLRTLITPIQTRAKIVPPPNRTSVALHIRLEDEETWPMKSPAIEFYIDALDTLANLLQEPLYIFIFTDHPDPLQILNLLQKRFSSPNFHFDCRRKGNASSANVLDDFFGMGSFDCLIRSDSNYSLMASKIFPYRVMIAPFHCERLPNKKYFIDQMLLQIGSIEGEKKPLRTLIDRRRMVNRGR